MKKRVVILLLSLLLFITGCSNKKEDELVLVTEAGFAPYEYYSNGEIVGVDIDIAKEIANYLGKKLVIKDVAFDSIINEVKTGKSDLGAAGISYTKERAEEVDFTYNYIESDQVIIVRDGSNIKSPEDLKGKVAVQLGTTADSYLTDVGGITLIREKKFLACIQDLKDSKVDAVVMDKVPAKAIMTDDLVMLDEPLFTDSYGMVVRTGNKELLDAANHVIVEMTSSGEIDRILLSHLQLAADADQEKVEKKTTLYDKFHDSLITDARYKYVLEGLKNTLIIALGAVVIGVILGTLFAVIRNYHDHTGKLKVLNAIAKSYVTIIRGTPSTLQLMIIYYVIFANSSVSMILVGICAFGINSAAYVAEIMRGGLNAVDKGQIEAGYALGLSYRQVMTYIIFPQALRSTIPSLGNEFITLVKETSIGAYIGIIELTKASDIIASRTYDYFFPLIIVAIIYLIITYGLSMIVSRVEKRLNNARN